MKKVLMTLLFCSIILKMVGGEDKILPYPIHQKQLANGLNVVTVPFGSPGIAAFYIVMRVGSRDEVEVGKSGFAHFFEHMMFRGTTKYPKDKYDEVLKTIGASANANTSIDRTVYHMTGDATKMEKMFELEADRFMNLKYSMEDFKAEAGAVKGEYTKNSASPYEQLDEKVCDMAFEKHTYKHTTMGFFKDVVDMPNQYDYSLSFFKRFYRPENATIVVVGDVKHEDIEALSAKYFGNWQKGAVQANIPTEPEQTTTKYTHVQVPNFPPFLSLNYKGAAFDDKKMDMATLDVLSSILFSDKSDLYNQLVVKEQKVYGINAGQENSRDAYLFNISVSLKDAKDLQYVKDVVAAALEKAKTTPVDAKVLADEKSHLKYGFAMHIDSPDAIAEGLSSFIWITGDPESLNRYYALYDKVTAEDIMRMAKKYFINGSLTIGTIADGAEVGVK
ncbi:MAG: pitrilysin family protein [Bacteroidota bacterium]